MFLSRLCTMLLLDKGIGGEFEVVQFREGEVDEREPFDGD